MEAGASPQRHAPRPEHPGGPLSPPHVHAVYARFWRRFWALVVDALFLWLVWTAITAAVDNGTGRAVAALFVMVYFVGLTVEGGTLGKRLFSLRVVRTDGQPVEPLRAFVRELGGKPLSALPAFLGFLWMLDDRHRQTWHDHIADTVVVREVRVDDAPPWSYEPPWVAKAREQAAPERS